MTQTVQIGPEGTATVILNGSGAGTARAGPISARETWQPAVASVSVATNTSEAQCKIYIGDSVSPANFIDGTLSGSTGDSTGNVAGSQVPLGYYIWAVWSGGDAGQVATLNVSGAKTI
jgi:hypothetical protein